MIKKEQLQYIFIKYGITALLSGRTRMKNDEFPSLIHLGGDGHLKADLD